MIDGLFFSSSIDSTKNFFEVVTEMTSYTFSYLLLSTIYWLPTLFILWAMDEWLFFELNLNARRAVFIEWILFSVPVLIWFFHDIPEFNPDFSFFYKCIAVAKDAFFYIYIISVFAVSQLCKERYVNRIKVV